MGDDQVRAGGGKAGPDAVAVGGEVHALLARLREWSVAYESVLALKAQRKACACDGMDEWLQECWRRGDGDLCYGCNTRQAIHQEVLAAVMRKRSALMALRHAARQSGWEFLPAGVPGRKRYKIVRRPRRAIALAG